MNYYLIVEIFLTFIFTKYFLLNYIDPKKINFLTVVSVFICFFFSFLTIIILPNDIASTYYKQCIENVKKKENNLNNSASFSTTTLSNINSTLLLNHNLKSNSNEINNRENETTECPIPFDYVDSELLQIFWSIIYWTNLILTCFLLRILSSFSISGQFTLKKKFQEFFNYFYYEMIIYLVFGVSLLVYLIYALSINVTELISIRALISSLNNIYSLINLTILLGIGLVKIPSIFFSKSEYQSKMNYQLFKIAKQRERLVAAECEFDDCLDEIKKANDVLNDLNDQKLRWYLDEIIKQTPENFQKKIDQRIIYTASITCSTLTEENLIKLNRKFKETNNNRLRLEASINELVDNTIELEEIIKNQLEPTRKFIPYNNQYYKSERFLTTLFKRYVLIPKIEWYFKCLIVKSFYRYLSYFLIVLSAFLFCSELFYSLNLKSFVPVYLIFRLLEYLNLTILLRFYIISLLLYISITAYHTLFTLNLFGLFKLTSNQQTDEFSLIFCTRYICSLSPAIALNMFNLIGLDYQSEDKIKPSYTKIMSELRFLNELNDFLYYLFPAILCLLSFFTFFKITDKLLHYMGYERFTVQDDITTALIGDGETYLEKAKKDRLRHNNTQARMIKNRLISDRNLEEETPNVSSLVNRPTNSSMQQNESINAKNKTTPKLVPTKSTLINIFDDV